MAKVKEVTLDNIEKEDILQMAKYIQQLEQLTKDQRGYILQLQQQLLNAGKKIQQQKSDTEFIVQSASIDL